MSVIDDDSIEIHGLRLAAALLASGLPESHLLVALLSFNLGVEFGQLLVAGASARCAYGRAWRLPAYALDSEGMTAAKAEVMNCTSQALGGDELTVGCTLPFSEAPQQ